MTKKINDTPPFASSTPQIVETNASGKAHLRSRIEEVRASISHTVDEIKDGVEGHYASVRETVSGILDWRDQLQHDPIVWSVGALSAGFALGYTLGYARKRAKPSERQYSALAAFADTLVEELGALGKTLPLDSLDPRVRQVFGFGLSELLQEIGSVRKSGRKPRATKRGGRRRKPAARST